MPKPTQSPRRVVQFLLGLWRISPVLTSLMFVTQIVFAVLTTTIAPIFVSQLLTHIADGTATLQTSLGLLGGYAPDQAYWPRPIFLISLTFFPADWKKAVMLP